MACGPVILHRCLAPAVIQTTGLRLCAIGTAGNVTSTAFAEEVPRGLMARCARAEHKVCTGPYPSYIVVAGIPNNEPCCAFICLACIPSPHFQCICMCCCAFSQKVHKGKIIANGSKNSPVMCALCTNAPQETAPLASRGGGGGRRAWALDANPPPRCWHQSAGPLAPEAPERNFFGYGRG